MRRKLIVLFILAILGFSEVAAFAQVAAPASRAGNHPTVAVRRVAYGRHRRRHRGPHRPHRVVGTTAGSLIP